MTVYAETKTTFSQRMSYTIQNRKLVGSCIINLFSKVSAKTYRYVMNKCVLWSRVFNVTFSRMFRISASKFCRISNNIFVIAHEYFSHSPGVESPGLLFDSGFRVSELSQWLELSPDCCCGSPAVSAFSSQESSWEISLCDDQCSSISPSSDSVSSALSPSSLPGGGDGQPRGSDIEWARRRGVRGTRGRFSSFG